MSLNQTGPKLPAYITFSSSSQNMTIHRMVRASARAWYGMEWNGTEILVWNMEDARMEWNGRFQEWNGRQSSIPPCQFHARFRTLDLQKNTYRCRVVINNIVTKLFNFNIYA